jgi:RNA polymerase sigma-70 factor (ECF subfamily)
MSVIPLQFGSLGPFGLRQGEADRPDQPPSRIMRHSRRRTSGRPDAVPAAARSTTPAERTVDQLSDEQLLEAYLQGERGAFRELIGRYSNELLHFLTRFLGSRAAAEDVFQDTFLQIHLSAETFDTSRRFKPWLFTIAANKARDYHRKHTRRAPMSLSAPMGEAGESRPYVDLLEADLPDPDAPIADAERSRIVKNIIDDMPVHLREILLLSYFQRLSYNQIADSLGIPLGTVKSRLHTAVATFARAWKAAHVTDRNADGGASE